MGILGTGLLFTSCKKNEEMNSTDDSSSSTMMTATYNYEFHNGQTVSTAAYSGTHPDNLTAQMMLTEQADGMTEIQITLMNTVEGEMYHIHAHDAADANTTPNGTPYNETPNADVFTQHVTGNGGTVMVSQMANMSFEMLTEEYDGFFVVHDPLQALSTTDISTYLIVSTFAREQTSSNLMTMSYDYMFNTGQVNSAYAYSGSHATDLSAKLTVTELADGNSRVSVQLMNTLDGQMYMIHAHDQADPNSTPNGTPYNETPNSDVLATMITGNGGTAMNSQMSTMSYTELTTNYEAFFVVHDPLQTISTTDPTTYVLLGVFAR
jgi:hypothetical protein